MRRELGALWLAARDPRVPWHAKAVAAAVVAYAVSPIDLVPDFVPVLGLLDDLILLPLGIWLVLRLISPEVMAELRTRAEAHPPGAGGRIAAIVIVCVWLLAAAAGVAWLVG